MLHEPATPSGRDPAGPYKARLGIWMFIFYTVFYAGFVAINLLSPEAMGTIVLAGLNLATVYGMALIVLALVQALIYNVMCRRKEGELASLEANAAAHPGEAGGTGGQVDPGEGPGPGDGPGPGAGPGSTTTKG